MQTICKCLGGSHSYGLNTPESDVDVRGVFLNTDYKHILGLGAHEHQKDKEGDTMLYEARRFVELLQNGNTGALEILFNKNWIELDSRFGSVFLEQKHRFIDSDKLFKCLRGYAQHELRLAMGMRPGEIGFKRYEAVKKYGFSPKNFCQLFRLMMVGEVYFQTGEFIVDCRRFPDKEYFEFLMRVKTQPASYTVGYIRGLYDEFEKKLVASYENRKVNSKFDHEYAAEALLRLYYPPLELKFKEITAK
jgi:predicted nucleotidyltransferase